MMTLYQFIILLDILTSPLSQLSLHPSFPLPGAVGLSAETPATSTTGTDTNNGVEDVTSIISLVKSKPQGTVKCMAQEVPGFLVADFMLLFPGVSIQGEGLNVILLSQHTVDDMTGWSPEVEEERERVVAGACKGLNLAANFSRSSLNTAHQCE